MTSDAGDAITNGAPPSDRLWTYEHEGIKYPVFFGGHPSEHLPSVKNMRCEMDDTIVCSYPKSGKLLYEFQYTVELQWLEH